MSCCLAALMLAMPKAKAATLSTSSDWQVELDTALAYDVGMRAQSRDDMISNNPIQQNNEYKFPNAGDIISDRLDLSTELSVAYQKQYGFDVSYAAWKDFAYGDRVDSNPNLYAPGVPYSSLSSSPDGHYGQYTNRFYNLGNELGNAFTFANFTAGEIPVNVKVGRFTEYWGNAVFSGAQAISYGQSPLDIIKAVDAPGTEVKNLFLPRGQLSVHIQPTDQLTFGFDYDFEYRYDRFPEGGTFLGVADPLFIGATSLEGSLNRGADRTPPNVDGNFGVEALYSPSFIDGTVGLYFRQFDDVASYAAFLTNHLNDTFNLAYARHVHLYGISYDRNIGRVSAGFEGSIRQNTGLLTLPSGSPSLTSDGQDGARGNTLNALVNGIYGLTPTRFYDTGTIVAEIAWTHLLSVDHNRQLFNGIGYACSLGGLAQGLRVTDGCATRDEVNLNVVFDPQWLQVFPGVDFDAPISVAVGLHGNGQTLALAGTGQQVGSVAYSAGIHALVRQKYNIKLQYVGYQSPNGKIATNGFGARYYATGDGDNQWNDKGQVDLIFSLVF